MATYVNDLRLKEIATGDESGTWGTSTNTNLELIAEAFSYGTEAITTNADTHTTTIADGSTDPGRSIYLKYTGTLDSACTITIGPNTVSKLWFIENATSGSQNIIISQGSGANITIPAGDTKVVYSDGAGSGAAVVDAFASLSVVDLKVQDDLTVTDDLIVNGDIDLEGSIDVNGTANLDVVDIDGAVDMATTLAVAGNVDFNGDLDVDGTTNLDVVDIDGATTISSQIFSQLAGNTTTGGNIQLGITTDDAAKYTAITAQQHDSGTETEGFTLIGGNSAAADTNLVNIGGGFGEQNPATALRFFTGSAATREGTVKATIDSSGNVGIGATTIDEKIHVEVSSGDAAIKLEDASGDFVRIDQNSVGANDKIRFKTGSGLDERMRIDSSGNVGIGTTSPASYSKLNVAGLVLINSSRDTYVDASEDSGATGKIFVSAAGSGDFSSEAGHLVMQARTHTSVYRDIIFAGGINNASELMRITGQGDVGIGGSPSYRLDVETSAFDAAYIATSINSVGGGVVLILNRSAADGDMMRFQQGGTTEGTIVVSGSTVSYNGFSGNHESSGINSSTPIGTVVSTIDELDVYSETQTDKGKDKPNPKSGQTRADHAKIKISDTEGDTRVYGILNSFNADGKAIVTSVGIGSIKVTGACNGGDLLESNGDGTAKVQSDDIVRSKTIGKVTIGNSDTGVKLVSCVLYCG